MGIKEEEPKKLSTPSKVTAGFPCGVWLAVHTGAEAPAEDRFLAPVAESTHELTGLALRDEGK
jgi:hypothetical protein